MNKFENSQEVEVINDDGVWCKYRYIIQDNVLRYHIVADRCDYHPVKDSEIRPVQLICDEARDVIKKAMRGKTDVKFSFDSDAMFMEYLKSDLREDNLLPSSGWQIIARKQGVCVSDKVVRYTRDEDRLLPQLNLSTGEVVPCDEVPPPASAEYFCNHCADMMYEIKTLKELVDVLKNQLKAERRENYSLEELCKEHVVKLKEKDTEIERLMKANDIINHSHSVIIQERDQWKELTLNCST